VIGYSKGKEIKAFQDDLMAYHLMSQMVKQILESNPGKRLSVTLRTGITPVCQLMNQMTIV
jgi:hypothetical protein